MGLFDSIQNWLAKPFDSGQSAEKWVLFVGLILVAMLGWQLILIHIVRDVE
jgi:hypothetical protein